MSKAAEYKCPFGVNKITPTVSCRKFVSEDGVHIQNMAGEGLGVRLALSKVGMKEGQFFCHTTHFFVRHRDLFSLH